MDIPAIMRGDQGLKTQLYDLQCAAEQCALMCFTGLTADSDEERDDAACHFVVVKKSSFSTGGEKIIPISSNTPLFLYLFEHRQVL